MKKNKVLIKKKKKLGFFDILNLIAESICRFFKNGPIGFFFSDLYTVCNQKWKNGFIYNIFRKSKRKMRKRATFSHIYERSRTNGFTQRFANTIIHSQLRIWGVAMLFFALSIIGVAILKQYIETEITLESLLSLDNEATFKMLILGTVIVALSLPLIISKKELGESLLKGRLTRFVIVNVLNLNPANFERVSSSYEGNYLSAGLFAISLGLMTYQLRPIVIVILLLAMILFSLTMAFPELGIVFLMIVLPFANVISSPYQTIVLLIILGFTSCGFVFKLLRGKRILRFELIDVLVLSFGSLIFFGGIFTYSDRSSFWSSELYVVFLFIYFLIVNMYIGKPSIYRAYKILAVTATLISIIGIIRGGVVTEATVDSGFFKDLPGRVSAFLGNPNMLGAYLAIIFPLVVGLTAVSKRKISKLMYFISCVFMVVCTVMTGSRGAWLGMIVATALFLILYNFKNIWIVIASSVALPFGLPLLSKILPVAVIDRFRTIYYGITALLGNGDAAGQIDSSIAYRMNIWENSIAMLKDRFLSGIGMGEHAFRVIYEGEIEKGEAIVAHAHSLPLQILLNLGVIGFTVFALIMFCYGQNCFIEIKRGARASKSRTMMIAGLASVTGALVVGLTDYIWYNYRVFIIFWMVVAITVALARNNVRERDTTRIADNMTSANLEINR